MLKNLQTDVTWQLIQMFSPVIRSQENYIVSANEVIIKTYVAKNAIIIIPRGQLKRLQ